MKKRIDIVADQKRRLTDARSSIAHGKRTPSPADLVGPRSNYPSDEFYATQISAATYLLAANPNLL